MTLEERIAFIRNNFPDPMNQSQFGQAIGVCKSTAYHLLRDGVVPYYVYQEKSNHYHMIQKNDVIEYLLNNHSHESSAYQNAGKKCISILLSDEPEILFVTDIMRITGLYKSSVQKWFNSGKLTCHKYFQKTIVKKDDLIDFMASSAYQDSSHKNIRSQAISMAVEWYQNVSNPSIWGGK